MLTPSSVGVSLTQTVVRNSRPKFRPILSAIGTCTYNIAKYLVPILANITENQYIIKDSFEFGKEVLRQDPNLFMGSLDVEALFTNIPLTETIDIICEKLFENQQLVSGLDINEFRTLLEIASHDPWFIFDQQYFEQIDGVSMGICLGPRFANICICYHEEKWLENCRQNLNLYIIDDMLTIFFYYLGLLSI